MSTYHGTLTCEDGTQQHFTVVAGCIEQATETLDIYSAMLPGSILTVEAL